ncbi:hypothetical protein JCM10213_007633 [Rhodosporidiobolus nylandii]
MNPARTTRRRTSVASLPSSSGRTVRSCVGCRERKQRCSRTQNCENCQSRGIDRTAEDATIEDQQREIYRLNMHVGRLITRVRELGGEVDDLVTAGEARAVPPASSSLVKNLRTAIVDTDEPASPPSPVSSRAGSVSSAASAPVSVYSGSSIGVRAQDTAYTMLATDESAYSSDEPPAALAAGPRSAPPTPTYSFPAPTSLNFLPSSAPVEAPIASAGGYPFPQTAAALPNFSRDPPPALYQPSPQLQQRFAPSSYPPAPPQQSLPRSASQLRVQTAFSTHPPAFSPAPASLSTLIASQSYAPQPQAQQQVQQHQPPQYLNPAAVFFSSADRCGASYESFEHGRPRTM